MLRIYLISYKLGGETSHAASHRTQLTYTVYFHYYSILTNNTNIMLKQGRGMFLLTLTLFANIRRHCLSKWKLSHVPGYKMASLKHF